MQSATIFFLVLIDILLHNACYGNTMNSTSHIDWQKHVTMRPLVNNTDEKSTGITVNDATIDQKHLMSKFMFEVKSNRSSFNEEELECKKSRRATDYMGTVSSTISGKRCQIWSRQTPHNHTVGILDDEFPDNNITAASNFCRNPDWGCYRNMP